MRTALPLSRYCQPCWKSYAGKGNPGAAVADVNSKSRPVSVVNERATPATPVLHVAPPQQQQQTPSQLKCGCGKPASKDCSTQSCKQCCSAPRCTRRGHGADAASASTTATAPNGPDVHELVQVAEQLRNEVGSPPPPPPPPPTHIYPHTHTHTHTHTHIYTHTHTRTRTHTHTRTHTTHTHTHTQAHTTHTLTHSHTLTHTHTHTHDPRLPS
jgi:hypothetical protein